MRSTSYMTLCQLKLQFHSDKPRKKTYRSNSFLGRMFPESGGRASTVPERYQFHMLHMDLKACLMEKINVDLRLLHKKYCSLVLHFWQIIRYRGFSGVQQTATLINAWWCELAWNYPTRIRFMLNFWKKTYKNISCNNGRENNRWKTGGWIVILSEFSFAEKERFFAWQLCRPGVRWFLSI